MAYTVIPVKTGPMHAYQVAYQVWHSESQSPASRLFETEAEAEAARERILRLHRFVDSCSYMGDYAHDGDESLLE